MRIFVFFYRPQTIILTITIILMITHKFNANKKAHPPKVQKLSEDGLLLSRICFLRLERVKIPLKSNKKRRLGTNNCILFCVLIWCGRRDSNPHGVTHRNLKPARLPISPRPPISRNQALYRLDFSLLYFSVLTCQLPGFSATLYAPYNFSVF